ncbi:MAG: ribosome-associated translation inhibitor RaiA [Erysipelotrichaceae bacterium]|nr:ribosome-associated translation inhibitor RaiA [Erysipelotrichaceae bacterium]
MKFAIYGEDVTITEEMRNQIEEKLSFLTKYFAVSEDTTARFTVKAYNDSLKIEVTIPTKVGLCRAEVVHDKFETGVDLAIDKIEDQIRRQKSRLSRRHKESLAVSFATEDVGDNDIPVKTKTIFADEMTLDDAILQMEMLSHSFFIYKDIDDKKVSVVYKRNDGQYGLIEVSE